ncbi:hypothetical protein L596_026230 [Steinernema carpocapsae]|uniref:Uncharacterized protein n=1 Tax=Steinernema carpocapsae TaxID=34508 RepID=A0A4U5M0V0_STECR|nr:hypothetical protein L596_026230 [Steinernema carpocapsae]
MATLLYVPDKETNSITSNLWPTHGTLHQGQPQRYRSVHQRRRLPKRERIPVEQPSWNNLKADLHKLRQTIP